ncbi:RNA-directed DNA polymerase, eukaryota, reverse transcriptase zinc-binding domain protein [Tanacetum coccineum]
MDKGFLNRISNGSKEVNKGLLEKGSLLGNIAAKVKNIDGKILGRDGKPMVARRCVRFSETTKESACGDGHDVIVDSSKVEHSPQAVAKCAVHDDGTRPVHGRNDTRVNDLNSHTNDAPIEHVISSVVCLPMEAIDEIKARFVNTLYGFPVGKRLAFPMVENYVKHAWVKYGLKRVMMHHGFFMFQFDSDSGMVKDKVTHVSLWLKMHNVPIVAYSKVGLDLISAKVGRLMRLDAHTNFICLNSWGHIDYARALVEVSADNPLVDSVDIDIPREDRNGYTTANIRIEFEWQPPRCGTCKIFDHLDSVGNQRYIKGYRVNIPKSKLVYRVVVKPQGDKNVASNMGQSLDTTKKPSPSDSSMNGMSSFINDDINLEELRNFVDKSMQEDSVLEQVGNYDINGYTSRDKQGEKVSSKKSSSSLEILNEDSDTDVDEVFVPKVRTTFPSSSGGGGHQLEEDAYDDYEDQFEDYLSLHQEFCDQFDFKVKGLDANDVDMNLNTSNECLVCDDAYSIIYGLTYLGGATAPVMWLQPWRVLRSISIFKHLMADARFRLLMLARHLPVVPKRCDYLHCGGVSFLSSHPWRIHPVFSTLYISIPLELWSLIILESAQCAFNRFFSDANDADMNLNTSSECSQNRKVSGSRSAAKKVELKAYTCDINRDDGPEPILQDPIASGGLGNAIGVVSEDDWRGPSMLYKSTTDGHTKSYGSSKLVLLLVLPLNSVYLESFSVIHTMQLSNVGQFLEGRNLGKTITKPGTRLQQKLTDTHCTQGRILGYC